MNEISKRGFSYILSMTVVTVGLIYVIDLPGYLTGAHDLINEYYYDNAIKSFILDIFLFSLYISISMWATQIIKPSNNTSELLTVVATTAAVSSLFLMLFKTRAFKGTFFDRWFKRVGYKAVIYDLILVSSVFIVMKVIHKKF